MIRKAFKMFLYPGMEEEYEKRHNLLWPEMKEMIHAHGGRNYSIYLDRETHVLYGYIEIENEALWAASADTPINRKWWDFMADIMETNEDNSPVSVDLAPVFRFGLEGTSRNRKPDNCKMAFPAVDLEPGVGAVG